MIAAEVGEPKIVSKLLEDRQLTLTTLADARYESEVSGVPLVDVLIARDLVSEVDVGTSTFG